MNRTSPRGGCDRFAVCLMVTATTLLPAPAHAYIDPGLGSMLVTSVLGLIAAVGYTFRRYVSKLRDLLGGRPKTPPDP